MNKNVGGVFLSRARLAAMGPEEEFEPPSKVIPRVPSRWPLEEVLSPESLRVLAELRERLKIAA